MLVAGVRLDGKSNIKLGAAGSYLGQLQPNLPDISFCGSAFDAQQLSQISRSILDLLVRCSSHCRWRILKWEVRFFCRRGLQGQHRQRGKRLLGGRESIVRKGADGTKA